MLQLRTVSVRASSADVELIKATPPANGDKANLMLMKTIAAVKPEDTADEVASPNIICVVQAAVSQTGPGIFSQKTWVIKSPSCLTAKDLWLCIVWNHSVKTE